MSFFGSLGDVKAVLPVLDWSGALELHLFCHSEFGIDQVTHHNRMCAIILRSQEIVVFIDSDLLFSSLDKKLIDFS